MTFSNNKSIALLFIVTGFSLIFSNISVIKDNIKFINTATKTYGKVISTPFGKFHPDIEFETLNGETITFTQNGFHKGYYVDDKVPIIYQIENPKQAKINHFLAIWSISIFIGVLALVFLFAGIFKYKNSSKS